MSPRRNALLRRAVPPMPSVAAPADKRFRRPDVRPGRRRRLGLMGWRTWRLAAVGLLVCGAGLLFTRAVLGSKRLAISHIVVRGNARLSTGEVEALVDGMRGENILVSDFDRYRRRLRESPWVADVTLWRVLPATVEVHVVERVPMAVARLGQQLYLVDRSGVIIDEFSPQYKEFDLPVVDGLVGPPSSGRRLVDEQRLVLASRFLDAVRIQPDLRDRISQLDVTEAHDVVALLDDDPAWLHLGDNQFVERLRTYFELAPTLHQRLADIDYVDLRFNERIYVRSRGRAATMARTAIRK